MARQEPPAIETDVATWLLHHSVPASAKAAVNPVAASPADIEAGHRLFQQKCEVCHAYDGGGKTEIGAGAYPHPPVLRQLLPLLSDGEVFYHVRNGIRNTAMPAWSMPDRQIWQLVAYMRHLPIVASLTPVSQATPAGAHYVGSKACASCHHDQYDRWSKTKMANVVRDPKIHPEAVVADFSKPNPLVTFTVKDVDFVYGSGWKQRYFHKFGNTYIPFPAQWDITHKTWSKYHVPDKGGDWWAPHYPDPKGDNSGRPTGPLCDGCHSVDFNITTSTPAEWNVGCEMCHGAGSAHVAHPTRTNILNPARMDYVRANDVCIQCHSQGQPLKNPINGKYYDYPVGYHVGLNLSDFWKLEPHKLGELTFTHFPDGTAHKNRMQGNDFVQSVMYERGVTCFSCHDPHGTPNQAILRAPVSNICLSCHGPNTQNGPHAVSIEAHTHHKAGSAGNECVSCHMPRIEQTIADVNVAAHTFKFITPAATADLKIPNPCTNCHKDKTTAWAAEALVHWNDRSPWRMAN
ncbi:MAG TPA: c-type cytochrome [Phenylobacterium sp.]|uniref:c-type cytochrome n=1 Tax=Phenylobacterium sp. TaxID=1871053 RepID=UPI002D4A500E|nr:c-type cytochrome [Phenylobacterium sp.]HZZ67331.1 c-type cytochrome [Phenylobacterium sp.]